MVERGLEELDRLGWKRCFVVGDTFGTATAVRIAHARRETVQGLALGHPTLSWEMEGERAPLNRELWDAMAQLMSKDTAQFLRYGITQLTQGSYDETVANRMVERIPAEHTEAAWKLIRAEHEPIGDLLGEIHRPLLFAKHQGCLMFTDEGFDDAVAAFPDARTLAVERAPSASEEFAQALREFCEQAEAAEAERPAGAERKS